MVRRRLRPVDAKLMGVISLASLTISTIGASLWMLITNFPAVIAFGKKLFGGGP